MVHKYLLENDTFELDYAVLPPKPLNAKGNAKRFSDEYIAYIEWQELYNGLSLTARKLVEYTQFEILKAMRLNFQEQLQNEGLTLGKSEIQLFWSEYIGFEEIQCRGMIDNLAIDNDGNLIAIDVKTTQSLNAKDLYYTCKKFRYDFQQAFYENGLAENGYNIKGFKFFFIEKKAPYDCRVVTLSQETIDLARLDVTEILEKYTNIDKEKPKGYEPLELSL
jgi:hypothetical protein